MKINWARHMATIVLSTSLLMVTAPIYVNADDTSSGSIAADYFLTDTIKAEVKSILNEQTAEGTRLGAVVRLYNQGSRIAAIPDDEVRVKTADGIEYTLRPSTANAKAILPKEKVELSYLVVVDRDDAFTLSAISWFDVNQYVYPKTEKLELSIPIPSIEWHGDGSDISNPSAVKKWEQSFTIPGLSASLEYKPVSVLKQNTSQGPAAVVTLLAENKGTMKQSIPDFRLSGKSPKKVFNGKRLEQDVLTLEPGEKQYIHYAIPIQNNDELKSLILLTPESFEGDNQTKVSYTIGRLSIRLPDAGTPVTFNQAESYDKDTPIRFDPLNKLIPSDVSVSLVELQMHGSEGDGYKAAVAKFKLSNNSDQPKPIPNLQAELTNAQGYSYMGTRQNLAIQTLIPNLNYVIYYTFVVPSTEKGDQLVMKILDGESAAPYSIPIAAFRTQIQNTASDSELAFYPFSVKLNNWKVSTNFELGSLSYSYKILLDMGINQDKAVVDQNFSKMKVEVSSKEGKMLGSQTFSLAGDNKLSTGGRTVTFNSEQLETSLIIKIYESIDTPFGEAKRLVKTLNY